ncbi:MAG: hypothetical protein KDD64_08860 [Bdellovibrionales bacterium]|nr:hypothetical protein [Bdellovibrionales bacterium]
MTFWERHRRGLRTEADDSRAAGRDRRDHDRDVRAVPEHDIEGILTPDEVGRHIFEHALLAGHRIDVGELAVAALPDLHHDSAAEGVIDLLVRDGELAPTTGGDSRPGIHPGLGAQAVGVSAVVLALLLPTALVVEVVDSILESIDSVVEAVDLRLACAANTRQDSPREENHRRDERDFSEH